MVSGKVDLNGNEMDSNTVLILMHVLPCSCHARLLALRDDQNIHRACRTNIEESMSKQGATLFVSQTSIIDILLLLVDRLGYRKASKYVLRIWGKHHRGLTYFT